MKKETKDPVREMLKKDNHRKILEKLVEASCNKPGILNKYGTISLLTKEVYHGRRENMAKVDAAIKTFSSPPYEIIIVGVDTITITEKALKYA
jgi:hypothetical protein